jgi:hypothetical protein
MISANNRVRWYVGLNRAAFVLAFGGMLAIGTGMHCLPFPIVNPKAFTSLFHVLAGPGFLVREARLYFSIGGVLIVISGGILLMIRAAFPGGSRKPLGTDAPPGA